MLGKPLQDALIPDGASQAVQFRHPRIAIDDRNGAMFVIDNAFGSRIRTITTEGTISKEWREAYEDQDKDKEEARPLVLSNKQ